MLGNHAAQQSRRLGCNPAFSGRIPERAFGRLPWAQPSEAPFAIAAPRTSAPRPRKPMVHLRACYLRACYPRGGEVVAGAARNFLQDWRGQDSVAPANGSTRQILLTTYSWPRVRTWPLDHDSAAPRPDGQTWDVRNSRTRELARLVGYRSSGLWISVLLPARDLLLARSRLSVENCQFGRGFSCVA
jgi:hypothetical protein